MTSASDLGDVEEMQAWRQAREEGSADARQRLFTRHAPLARRIAARRYRSGPSGGVDYMDLRQLAYAGLLEAIDRFDLSRGTPFRVYAARRIDGSVLDGLAKMTEMREQVSYRNRLRAERVRALTPAHLEDLSAVGALGSLTDLVVDLALGFMLDAAGLAGADDAADPHASPYDSVSWAQTVLRLREAIVSLPGNEQGVIRQHYVQEMDFARIAQLLGLSRSRVSQLHRAGLARLRRALAPNDS